MTGLNTLERDDLLRRIAWLNAEVDNIKRMLKGEQVGTARIADAAITNAKIKDLTWDKARGGTATLGGLNNTDGILSVKDASNVEKVVLDKDGILINDGKIVIKNDEDTTFLDSKGLVSSAVFGIYGGRETTISNIVGSYGPTILSSPSIEITTKRINTNILLFLTITSGGYPTNPSSDVTNSGFAISTYEENIIQDYLLYGPYVEYEACQIISSGAMDNMKVTTRSAINIITLADIGTYNFKVSISQTGSNLTTVIPSIFLSACVLGQ
ncbi:MAG: hypothetical protein BWX61_00971 [Bacteroidetes bacterium ADurb.Bin035]|nr:MAG: hypothetical protein BWX61_00971 [Bacteroidetes bacterium ADurb.Bin035]